MLAEEGPARKVLIDALLKIWESGPERTSSPDTSITVLGIDWYMDGGYNIRQTQERFTNELLVKYSMNTCKPIRNVTMDKILTEPDPPTPEQLRELQAFAGAFNWLATRTRPDAANGEGRWSAGWLVGRRKRKTRLGVCAVSVRDDRRK